MKFFKCLAATLANKPSNDDFFTSFGRRITYWFDDTTDPKYPKVKIWSDGEVTYYDQEGKAYKADDDRIAHYCSLKENELMARFSTWRV